MKKTLCKLSLSSGLTFYLLQNEQNNLVVSENPIMGQQPLYDAVVIADTENKIGDNFKKMFLSGEIFNTEKVAVLCHGKSFKSLKDLLEKGIKIPPHQMPNIPNNHGQQMHNMVPVFNPQNQQNDNVASQPQYPVHRHFRHNQDNRNSSYDKTQYNNQNEYNKYANKQLIRELVNSPERHITALQNGGYGNQRY
ncbi:MAG: hypothetical protein IJT14_03605 [Rickettsiales bacterium]|nr:hypothetical protein [Rickettsiales bacterium]